MPIISANFTKLSINIWAVSMKNKRIEALNELLNSIDQKNFNYDAWKIKASIIIQNIFGVDDSKVELLKSLHYDYSSWSLRDENGTNIKDSVKDQARSIIDGAILELSMNESDSNLDILEHLLSTDEFEHLQSNMVKSKANEIVLTEYFSKIAPAKKDLILAKILLKEV